MKIVITGASGFVGRRLIPQLEAAGHTIHALGRKPKAGLPASVRLSIWDPEKTPAPAEALNGADAVIHLAGEPVAQRWSPEVKRRITASRVDGTRQLIAGLAALDRKPQVLVSASAVGYYGHRGDEVLAETAMPGSGFLADVCVAWEKAAMEAAGLGMRIVTIRIGLVLGIGGGALEKILPPFKLGVGGRLGPGTQWMPWIHLDDLCGMMRWAAENEKAKGPLNGAAPNPVKNSEFTATLGRLLHRPAIFPVPEFAIRLLYGEMSQILFNSQRAIPKAVQEAGFQFRYPELSAALKDLLG